MPTKSKQMTYIEYIRSRTIRRPGRNKYVTGFCGNLHCEGTRPKNHKGKGLKTCPWWDTCPCLCHKEQDEMFEILGMERRLVENPEYIPERTHYVMPDPLSPDETFGRVAKKRGPIDTEAMTGEPITTDAILKGTVFNQTPSGQRTRGGLEYQVLSAVNKALEIWPEEIDITPHEIGAYIASRSKQPAPSNGAIDAVWRRWTKMQFAVIGSRPIRFLAFAGGDTQTHEDLERAKLAFKRGEKMQAAAASRTIRRRK